MGAMDERPSPEGPQQNDPSQPDWEAFYASYRKPGYVPGFEIGHKLGGGVFGVVYKARKESIGKAYAIKFLRVDDPSIREQVLSELEQVGLFAQVDHPNLVSIEDKGIVDGIPYIVMGYAGEETLKARIADATMSDDEALRVWVQVARGVQALHEHSLVHFDLKPANVFLKGDVARVGDYGLSKLITETAMSLTAGRGTPYYMAPEMLRRRGDHRADVYSLGILLYECLCSKVPFTGSSEWEVLKAHEEGELVFDEAVPHRFRPLISRMLEKDPDARYQSVAEVLRELAAPVDLGESIRLDLPPASEQRAADGPQTRGPALAAANTAAAAYRRRRAFRSVPQRSRARCARSRRARQGSGRGCPAPRRRRA